MTTAKNIAAFYHELIALGVPIDLAWQKVTDIPIPVAEDIDAEYDHLPARGCRCKS